LFRWDSSKTHTLESEYSVKREDGVLGPEGAILAADSRGDWRSRWVLHGLWVDAL